MKNKPQLYTSLLEDITTSTNDIVEAIDILEECVVVLNNDTTLLEDKTAEVLKKIQPFLDNPTSVIDGYKAISTEIQKEVKWNDEKGFVNKLIALIKGVIKWLMSLAKGAFAKLRDFIARAIGATPPEKVEKKVKKLEDFLTKMVTVGKNDTLELIGKPKKTNKFTVYTIKDEKNLGEVMDASLTESVLNEVITIYATDELIKDQEEKLQGEQDDAKKKKIQDRIDGLKKQKEELVKKEKDKDREKRDEKPMTRNVVVFDLKSELYGLKTLTDHFLSIYDNAYGTNHENLFGVSDLEMIVELFVGSINDLKQGKVRSFDTRSGYVEIKPIEATAVRDNLIKTQSNISSLRDIFQQSHNGIENIARLINAKQMQALSASPQIYKFLSMESYGNMKSILDVLGPRIDDAKDMQDQLDLAKKKFEAVAKELESLSPALSAMGNMTYLPEHQKRTINLLQSSKYLIQTTQLRLGAVTLYVRYLEEIYSLIQALTVGGSQFVEEFKLKW